MEATEDWDESIRDFNNTGDEDAMCFGAKRQLEKCQRHKKRSPSDCSAATVHLAQLSSKVDFGHFAIHMDSLLFKHHFYVSVVPVLEYVGTRNYVSCARTINSQFVSPDSRR
jgi:hypothetical protein